MLATKIDRIGAPAKGIMVAAVLVALGASQSHAQRGASRLQGPDRIEQESANANREALMQKERFRRQAAEAAQKQLELLADQLREELGKEIAARKKAEAKAADMTARATLTDQIDQERQRIRREKIKALEERRELLEREVVDLSQRLANENARRKSLEEELRLKPLAVPSEDNSMRARIKELERKFNASEWARKLAEAQLQLVTGQPTPKQ